MTRQVHRKQWSPAAWHSAMVAHDNTHGNRRRMKRCRATARADDQRSCWNGAAANCDWLAAPGRGSGGSGVLGITLALARALLFEITTTPLTLLRGPQSAIPAR